MIYTIIAKPTKACNADCSYCSAPPDGASSWTVDDFKFFLDRLSGHLNEGVNIIWHGGEPMLMGPEFYVKCWEHAKSVLPNVKFSMQTNLLLYKSARWKNVFNEIIQGRLSTSYDPDEVNRTIKGSPEKYGRVFRKKLDEVLEDGFRPMVIGTYTQLTWPFAEKMYELSAAKGDKAFPLRFNYRYPAGRDEGKGEMITPDTYGRMLIALYDRWIRELPDFTITPLDQMFGKVVGIESERCPWTAKCGGRFIGIEPSGDVYNCSEFADVGNEYRFGNLRENTPEELFSSKPAVMIRRRPFSMPLDCVSCRHFNECEGGCMRDAVLYERGLGGKFYYCESWKMVFDRIKASIVSGEADGAIRKFGMNPQHVRSIVSANNRLSPFL